MAYNYSHIYNLPSTGLRFFTVYGPWGRPIHGFIQVYRKYFIKKKIDFLILENIREILHLWKMLLT